MLGGRLGASLCCCVSGVLRPQQASRSGAHGTRWDVTCFGAQFGQNALFESRVPEGSRRDDATEARGTLHTPEASRPPSQLQIPYQKVISPPLQVVRRLASERTRSSMEDCGESLKGAYFSVRVISLVVIPYMLIHIQNTLRLPIND